MKPGYDQRFLKNVDEAYVEEMAAVYAEEADPHLKEKIAFALLDELMKVARATLEKLNNGIAEEGGAYEKNEGELLTQIFDAARKALKGFDPKRGKFCPRYLEMHSQIMAKQKKEKAGAQYAKEIRPNADGVPVYAAPNYDSHILRYLNRGEPYRCLAIREDSNGDWYVVQTKVKNSDKKGYVSAAEDVQYYYLYDTVDLHKAKDDDNDDTGNEPQPPEPKTENTPPEIMIVNEKMQASLFALLCAFYQEDDTKGLSRKVLFRQFFTENTIHILQETGDLLRKPVYHETLIMQNLRRDWQDFLLTEPGLTTFRQLSASRTKTHHDILSNGDQKPIEIPYDEGVAFPIRYPYLAARYTSTQGSMRTRTSENHTLFKSIFERMHTEILEKSLPNLAEEYKIEASKDAE